MNDKEAELVGGCAALLIAPPVFAVIEAVEYVWTGWVLAVLWGWFAVPYFGARPLPLPLAVGVLLIVAVVTNRPVRYKDHRPDLASSLVALALGPAFILAAGWITHHFFLA